MTEMWWMFGKNLTKKIFTSIWVLTKLLYIILGQAVIIRPEFLLKNRTRCWQKIRNYSKKKYRKVCADTLLRSINTRQKALISSITKTHFCWKQVVPEPM